VATLTPSDIPIPATLTETPIILPPRATSTILIVPPTDTSTASATPYAFTATSQAATSRVNTAISCGPPYNWVRNYTVQPGDTLYRIALAYSTTTYELQRANCKGSSTNIAVGERLWVPNVTPQMPATSAPTYQVPTDPVTLTPLPFTSSPEPADPAAETTSDTP
ncbi:MAG TPA: LysM peptidoglycan-binding domain-containing protein, partial [Rugosimonospora sp.]|nr:LysM peptidoglycan-binding domain-containing protein [Rugosimonospora sp.]